MTDVVTQPEAMPPDEYFLAGFRSSLLIQPSSEISGLIRYSGQQLSIAEAQARERDSFLITAKTRWRTQQENKLRAERELKRKRVERLQFERDAADRVMEHKLSAILATYRAISQERSGMEEDLKNAQVEEDRVTSTEFTDLTELQTALANARDLLAAIRVRSTQVETRLARLVKELSQVYPLAKAEFVFRHAQLRKSRRPLATIKELDRNVGFFGGRFSWSELPADGKPLMGPALLTASIQLEKRFAVLDRF
jgi:hypothetical protein